MPIVIEPKKKPPTRRKEKTAKKTKAAGEWKMISAKLARKRKPSDLKRVMRSLKLPGLVGAPSLIEKMLKDPSMSSDKLKANIAMLKDKFGKKTQSTGPAGKVMKKKRGGKVSGEDANLTRKLKKNVKLLKEKFKGERIKRR